MDIFPLGQLRPLRGQLRGSLEGASIEIPLEPFTLEDVDETIETSLRLEGISLPTMHPEQLSGRTFKFPTNPTPGYIDGSIYVEYAHHPVDVIEIRFGSFDGEVLGVELTTKIDFEFEGLGDYAAVDWVCRTTLRVGSVH